MRAVLQHLDKSQSKSQGEKNIAGYEGAIDVPAASEEEKMNDDSLIEQKFEPSCRSPWGRGLL